MINALNDERLAGYISKIHLANSLLDRAMAEGNNHQLFLFLKTLFDNADDAMDRLNELARKEGNG